MYQERRHILELTQAKVAALVKVSLLKLERHEIHTSDLQKANSKSVTAIARVYAEGDVRFLFDEGDVGSGVRLLTS